MVNRSASELSLGASYRHELDEGATWADVAVPAFPAIGFSVGPGERFTVPGARYPNVLVPGCYRLSRSHGPATGGGPIAASATS